MTDPTKVDSSAAREAAMSRVQTQDTVLASLAAPASKEGEESSKETKPKDNQNEEGDQKAVKKTAQERIVELAHKRKEAVHVDLVRGLRDELGPRREER